MNYTQALKHAPTMARGREVSSFDGKRPITVERAIDAFPADLMARGQNHHNATSIRHHLKDTPLFNMPVAILEKSAVTDVRNGLVKSGLKASTADRVGRASRPR
jgi:hypothetical protein